MWAAILLAAFVDATAEAGLAGIRPIGERRGTIDGLPFSFASGVGFFDLHEDGWPDLYVCHGAGQRDVVCRNDAGRFSCAGVDGPPNAVDATAFSAGDLDGDGDDDLVIGRSGDVRLWRNDGGALAEATAAWGPAWPRPIHVLDVALGDVDRDGDLDAYLGAERREDALRGALLRNDGGGRLSADLGAGLEGVQGAASHGQAVLLVDLDGDGDLDLYRAGDLGPDLYFRNLGDGTFALDLDHGEDFGLHTGAAMGLDAADFDRDGDLDLYLTDDCAAGPDGQRGNTLYVNDGAGRFANRANALGVQGYWSWGCGFEDFDADGWPDLAVAGAQLCLFRSLRAEAFEPECHRVTGSCRDGAYDHDSYSIAAADFDRDGDVDFALASQTGTLALYRNDTPQGRWLRVRLRGRASAIGAVVTVRGGGVAWRRDRLGPTGHGSQRESALHFGLGEVDRVSVHVRWPDGSETLLPDVPADREVEVVQPREGAPADAGPADGGARDRAGAADAPAPDARGGARDAAGSAGRPRGCACAVGAAPR